MLTRISLAKEAGVDPSELDKVFHGTTIATNIVIEHTGATVGMITTEGFRDILTSPPAAQLLNYQISLAANPVVRSRYRLTVPGASR
jgi:N-methylhydantoinase A/oxoprolinase/acetone carboxylase beta subunit